MVGGQKPHSQSACRLVGETRGGKKMSAFFGLPGLLLINFQQDVSATCLFLETWREENWKHFLCWNERHYLILSPSACAPGLEPTGPAPCFLATGRHTFSIREHPLQGMLPPQGTGNEVPQTRRGPSLLDVCLRTGHLVLLSQGHTAVGPTLNLQSPWGRPQRPEPPSHQQSSQAVCISEGCHNKLPQVGGLITEIYFLAVLGVRSPESGSA